MISAEIFCELMIFEDEEQTKKDSRMELLYWEQ
jgi:hypothetical protein